MWGTGRDTEPLFAECLSALAADPAVAAVALAVDLVPEFDGDESYPRAVLAAAAGTAKPVAVLAGLPAAVDQVAAARLRAAGVPVLEGTRTGLLALRHLLDHADPPASPPPAWPDPHRAPLATAPLAGPSGPELFDLLREYGIRAVRTEAAAIPASRPGGGRRDRLPGRAQDRRAGHRAQVRRRRGPARPRRPGRGRRRLRRPGRPAGPAGAGVRDRRRQAPNWRWASSATPRSVPSW